MTTYLITDSNCRSHRGVDIPCGHIQQAKHVDADLISQNIWECASSPLLAVMLNPLYEECIQPRLFAIRSHKVSDGGDEITVNLHVRETQVPSVSPKQKLAFAMYAIRELSPNHAFSFWVEHWLSHIDRSATAIRLTWKALLDTANDADYSLDNLNYLGASISERERYHDSEFEFLRRAREVVMAAMVYVEKPQRWQITMAERVASAVAGRFTDDKLLTFAELAMHVAVDELPPRPHLPHYFSEPKQVFRQQDRCRDDMSPPDWNGKSTSPGFPDTGNKPVHTR